MRHDDLWARRADFRPSRGDSLAARRWAWLLALWLALAAAPAAAAPWAAEVLFVSGEASWRASAAQPLAPLRVGERVAAGATLSTGADGHAYLATLDRGFLALRPNTRLRLARYSAHPDTPEIRLELEYGVARVVTGAAAQARRDRFRLETPIAAIGVRGTDFSVQGDAESTRVSVRRGGVVVSPFHEACLAGGLGPCEGPLTAELHAHEGGYLIEVRRGLPRAVRVRASDRVGPDGATPGRPEEKALLGAAPGEGGVGQAPATDAATRAELDKLNEARAQTGVSVSASTPSATVFWGRWAGDPKAFQALTGEGQRAVVAANPWYVISRTREPATLPRDGRVSLRLAESEAWIVRPDGVALAPANVQDGALSLDFGKQSFDTRLSVQGGGRETELRAAGRIEPDGQMQSSWLSGSTGSVRGAVENHGRAATYLFHQALDPKAELTGVAHWVRP